uniref:Uncharacterized protein n=1 Tax=Anguilla anguilla TaxID=7936 RepID=A0A0E9SHV0_ANGAN
MKFFSEAKVLAKVLAQIIIWTMLPSGGRKHTIHSKNVFLSECI